MNPILLDGLIESRKFKNTYGTILYFPIRMNGTGFGNLSEYYLWNNDTAQWQSVNGHFWEKNLKLPDGAYVRKGIWPDLKNMEALAYFYPSRDGNCCPNGGKASCNLAIENRKFVISSVDYDLNQSTSPENFRR